MAKIDLTRLTLESVVKTPVPEFVMAKPIDQREGKYKWTIIHTEFGIYPWQSDSTDAQEVVEEYVAYNGIVDKTPAVRAVRGVWDADKVVKPKATKKGIVRQAAAVTSAVSLDAEFDNVPAETV